MVSTILLLSPVFWGLYEIAPLIFGLAGVAVFGILARNYGPGVIAVHALMVLMSGLLALIIWHASERAAIEDSSPSREAVLAVAARHGQANPATEYGMSRPARNPELRLTDGETRSLRHAPGQFRSGMKRPARMHELRADDRLRII